MQSFVNSKQYLNQWTLYWFSKTLGQITFLEWQCFNVRSIQYEVKWYMLYYPSSINFYEKLVERVWNEIKYETQNITTGNLNDNLINIFKYLNFAFTKFILW